MNPDLQTIDQIRKEGFRPSVISLIVNKDRVLMCFKKEYTQWIFPQGRIDNGELPGHALVREIMEEIGPSMVSHLDDQFYIIGEDRLEFPQSKHGVDELQTDEGKNIKMIGKQYYLCVIKSNSSEIKLEKNEFDQCHWASYKEAKFLTEHMLHKNKKESQGKIVELLKEKGYIK